MKSKDIEIKINLYLDGQLSQVQQEEVEKVIETDSDARALFEQLRQTDSMIKNAAVAFNDNRDDSFEAIYSQARDSIASTHTNICLSAFLRFASGIAAGLLIALGIFFVYSKSSSIETADPHQIAINEQQGNQMSEKVLPVVPYSKDRTPLVHDVDLYYYKDKKGDEWLIEGIRHEIVKQASAGSI